MRAEATVCPVTIVLPGGRICQFRLHAQEVPCYADDRQAQAMSPSSVPLDNLRIRRSIEVCVMSVMHDER